MDRAVKDLDASMPESHKVSALRDLLEHERARRFAARHVLEQLAALAAGARVHDHDGALPRPK
jgi:hypothetical protein